MAQWTQKKTGVTVTSNATTLDTATIVEGASVMWVEVSNLTKAFDTFTVEYRPHTDATFYTIASIDSDYTTDIAWPVLMCSTDLTALDSDSSGLLSLDVKAINAVRFKAASSSVSDTTAAIKWGVR
jgi:hypothetical protein